jgi:hypothetical protein
MPTLPTPFPIPPPHCTLDAVYDRLLATLRDRSRPEQEALLQAIGRLFRAMHEVSMFDADYRAWSEAHRIAPQLECALRRHWAESKDFLQ